MKMKELLMEYGCSDLSIAQETKIPECTLTFLQLRDKLCLLGKILYEDLERQIYVTSIRAGFGDLNSVVVAMQLEGTTLYMAGYAKEGILKQNIYGKAVEKLQSAIQEGKVIRSSLNRRFLPLIFSLVVIASFVIILKSILPQNELNGLSVDKPGTAVSSSSSEDALSSEELAFNLEVDSAIEATKAYNEAVKQFNLGVAEYNEAAAKTCIDNLDGLPQGLETLSIESERFEDVAEVIKGDNSKELIVRDTATIIDMTEQVYYATTILKQITAPSGKWVAEKISVVDGITGTQAVTDALNPDGLLGKEGGYSDCIYFTVSSIEADEIPGSSIVAKGTDAGGAIEIYATLADAEARCEYLSGFDGTVLYSGSYAIVGTMIIRTSYKLNNEQQCELTNLITQALTAQS